MKKILVIDNYDSFTYNLVHQLSYILKQEVDVFRNDKITLGEIDRYESILLSPGPGIPKEAGIMPELLKRYSTSKKILGVCLGHQCIAESFGGTLLNLEKVVHGKGSEIEIIDSKDPLYGGVPEEIMVGRYHSWVVDPASLPEDLIVTAYDRDMNIMSLRHKTLPIYGVQYHPESVLTDYGINIIENWLKA